MGFFQFNLFGNNFIIGSKLPVDFDDFFDSEIGQAYSEDFKKNRIDDFSKIDINKEVNIIHGVSQIGKTIFFKLWLAENKSPKICFKFLSYKHLNKNENAYFLTKQNIFFKELAKRKNETYLIIIDDIETIDKNSEDYKSLNGFVSEFCDRKPKNLKLFFGSWTNVENDFFFKGITPNVIHLNSYNIKEIKEKFLALPEIDNEKFEKIEKHYGGHPLLLDLAHERLSNGKSRYIDLFKDKSDVIHQLRGAYFSIFKDIPSDIIQPFQKIVLTGAQQPYHSKEELEKLKELSLINQIDENTYIIHNHTQTLAREYYKEKKDKNFIETGKKIINQILGKIEGTENSVGSFQQAFAAFVVVSSIDVKPKEIENTKLDEHFLSYIEGHDAILFTLFGKDNVKNLKNIESLKAIIEEDYYLYLSIINKEEEKYEDALSCIERFKLEKEGKNSFDEKSQYSYYFEKGNISRELKKDINKVIELYKSCLANQHWIKLEDVTDISDPRAQKHRVKQYVLPIIELACCYIELSKYTEDLLERENWLNEAKDLLHSHYVSLENCKLENNAIYNFLGDIYQETRDNESAIQCYEKSFKIKDNHYKAIFNLGKLYCIRRNYSEAYKYWNLGIENEIFAKNNYVIGRYYAICLREEKRDYDKSLEHLYEALTNIEKREFKEEEEKEKNREKGKTNREIQITLIKKMDFEKIQLPNKVVENSFWGKMLMDKDNVLYLLQNVSDDAKIKIIDWLFGTYKKYEIESKIKEIMNYLYSKKLQIILEDPNDDKLHEFLIKYDHEFQPKLLVNEFTESERKRISAQYFKILENSESKLTWYHYAHCLLQYVSNDNSSDRFKFLSRFFKQISEYDDNYFMLFKTYKNVCLSLSKLDFIDLMPLNNEDLLKSFRFDLGNIAKLCLQKDEIKKAKIFYNLALEYEDNYQNNLDYAIFSLMCCDFSEFKKYYEKSIEKKSLEIDEKTPEKTVKNTVKARLNNSQLVLKIPENTDYTEFIKNNKDDVAFISTSFGFDLKLKILLEYSNIINKHSNKNIIIEYQIFSKYYQNEQYFLAKERYSKKLSTIKKDEPEWLKKQVEICNSRLKQFNETVKTREKRCSLEDKIDFANRFFRLGDYENAFKLYTVIIKKIKNSYCIVQPKVLRKALAYYIYCADILKKEIPYQSCQDAYILLLFGRRYYLLKRNDIAIECYNRCIKRTSFAKYKIEALSSLSKIFNEQEESDKAFLCIEEALKIEEEALKLAKDNTNELSLLPIGGGLSEIYYLKAILLFEKEDYRQSFHLFNRTYIRTEDRKMLEKKLELYELLSEDDKERYAYEVEYIETLKLLVPFIRSSDKDKDKGKLKLYFESVKSVLKICPDNNIVRTILDIFRMYKKDNENLFSDELILILENLFLVKGEIADFNLWRTLGNLFKEHEDYEKAAIFYKRMGKYCKTEKEHYLFSQNMALLLLENNSNNFDLAEFYLNEAHKYARQCANNEDKYLKFTEDAMEKLKNVKSSTS